MAIRSHLRFADDELATATSHDYGVPAGYKDVLSSFTVCNPNVNGNGRCVITLNPAGGAHRVFSFEAAPHVPYVFALWIVVYANEVVRVSNIGTAPLDQSFGFALSGVRYQDL